MSTVKTFDDLEIWQLARQLDKEIFLLTKSGNISKDFELKNQMRRSSGAIMDNIAEGFGRGSRLEFIQFLTIAKASAAELQSQLIRCKDRDYVNEKKILELNETALKIGNKIGAFIRYLNQSNIKGQKFLNRITKQTSQTPNEKNAKHQTPNKIITANAAQPLGAYPHARRAGNLLFLSGIGSRNPLDNSIPGLELDGSGNISKYNIEAECYQVFANVKAVLEAAGSSWENIIDVTVFLTNMKEDFTLYNKVYNEYFKDVQACRTTVEVKSLPTQIAIELKVIATIN
jgi:2-aminomuconate deaminase